MAAVRFLFILGLILMFAHRMVFGMTPPWLDVIVLAYLLFFTISVTSVVALRKIKMGVSAHDDSERDENDLRKLK